ncbi:MAG: hypothetical protein JO122_12360 [Acetobacteraceae bacterium]|nr:hypothetical protein [Acetobacteraceae bacterium]
MAATDPGQETPLQARLATPPTPMAGGLAGAVQIVAAEGEMPASEAAERSAEPSALTAGSSDPPSRPAAAVPQPPHLVLSAAEIGELLARGDAFSASVISLLRGFSTNVPPMPATDRELCGWALRLILRSSARPDHGACNGTQ